MFLLSMKKPFRDSVKAGDIFVIDGGDGDQRFFGVLRSVKLVECGDKTRLIFGAVPLLFEIEDQEYVGEHLVVRPRSTDILEDLRKTGWSMVIIYNCGKISKISDIRVEDLKSVGFGLIRDINKKFEQ